MLHVRVHVHTSLSVSPHGMAGCSHESAIQAELSGRVEIWERVPEGERGVVLLTFLMSHR